MKIQGLEVKGLDVTEISQKLPEQTQPADSSDEAHGDIDNIASAKPDDPLTNAFDAAKVKEAGKAKPSLSEKLPVFDFAGAFEDINDTSLTFDGQTTFLWF